MSNIAFSPALVGQLSFYARRLRKEELTRRLGLIFTVMALVVQSLAVFSPPEPANASSDADFVRGGVSSVKEFLGYYDRNHRNIKSIFNSLGITRAEIAAAKRTVIGENSRYNWSMTSLYSHAQGQRSWDYGSGTVYYRPMRLTQQGGDSHPVFASHSKSMGWFAIKIDCGNLITDKPPHPPKPDPVAKCENLNVTKLSSTRFRFNAKATVKNGAKVKTYIYTVRHGGGIQKTIRSDSSKTTDSVTYSQSKPGTYYVYLSVQTTEGKKTNSDCSDKFTVPQKPDEPDPEEPDEPDVVPFAECKSVQALVQDRTLVSLSGSATVENGASISSYTFTVRNANGDVVKSIPVESTQETAYAPSFTLNQAGDYSVTLSVATSEGTKTDPVTCVANFTISQPEVCQYNPQLPPNSPDCQPCPENPNIWIKDERCSSEIINTKTATNISRGNVDATTAAAKAGDKIRYTVTVENRGLVSDTVSIRESLGDVLQYATLFDSGNGSFDKETSTLTWNNVSVPAGGTQSRVFVVQMLKEIPLTNTGTSDEASYDCRMVNTFGNSVEVNVECPVEKVVVEQTVSELPHTGPRENMIFAGVLLATVAYFYARSRQLGKEVRLIRKNVNAGTI